MPTSVVTASPTRPSPPQRGGVRAEMLYFVPLGETLEVWRLRVRNDRDTRADLSVFSLVEFCLWDALDDSTNFQRNFSVGEVEVVDGVIYHKTEYRERRNHFAYFACSEPLAGFDTQRDVFLGPNRGWDSPLAVERGRCFDSIAHGWAPIGSHHIRLSLAPSRDARRHLHPRLLGEPHRREVRPTRDPDHQQGPRPTGDRALAGNRGRRAGFRCPA